MANIVVFDVNKSKELSSARCFVFTNRKKQLPTHDELFANKGEILKNSTSQAAADCVAQIVDKNEKFQKLVGATVAAN